MKIGIIGAGILGRLLTIEFAKQGYAVSLFEKDDAFSTFSSSATAAGMLNPWSEILESSDFVCQLGILSLNYWQEIIKTVGAQNIIFHCGTSHVSSYRDKEKIEFFLKHISEKHANLNYLRLNQKLKEELFSTSSLNYPYGFYLPNEKCLDPRLFILKSNTYFRENKNISFFPDTYIYNFDYQSISCNEKTEKFDFVIHTTGYHAKQKLQDDLRGVRGSLILVDAKQVNINCIIRLSHLRYPIYIVPRGQHKYIIGATSHETECLRPMTVEATLELLSTACQFDSGFLEAHILEQRVNLRPAFTSGDPKICYQDKVFYLNGLYRHGITISPTISHYFCQFIKHNFKLPPELNMQLWNTLWNN